MSKEATENIVTKEQLLRVLPRNVRGNLTDQIVDTLNKTVVDPNFREIYRDNLLGFSSVIREGKYKLQSYIDAVRYVSYVSTGSNGIEAYAKTFPDRYQRLLDDGAPENVIASYATTFKKTQLVTKIFEQQMVPIHIFNADKLQKAINTQAILMVTAQSEKVRSDAANSLMTHLKPPTASKMELDISYKQDKSLDDLRAATQELVRLQRNELEARTLSPLDVARSKLVPDEEIVDVD